MADKIEIFKLDIDIESVLASTAQLKSETDALKDTYTSLKNSTTATSAEVVKAKAAYDASNATYKVSQRELTKLTALEGKEITTINEARNALSLVTSQWSEQASIYGENSAEVEKLAEQKKKLTDALKLEEAKTGDTSRNVGNYTEGITDAIVKTNLFGSAQSEVAGYMSMFSSLTKAASDDVKAATATYKANTAATNGMSGAQKAAIITTEGLSLGLKLLRVALISTGIGAIVVVLGSLIAYLTTTQEGIDKVTSVTRPLRAAFETLLGLFQKFGGYVFNNPLDGLTKIYEFIKNQLVVSFSGLLDIMQGVATLNFDKAEEGLNSIKNLADSNKASLENFAKGLQTTFSNALDRGSELDAMMKQLSKTEADFIDQQSLLKQELRDQNLIAEDQTKTQVQREAAAKRTIEISREINAQQVERLQLEKDILEIQTENNDTSDADKTEIAEKLAQIRESNAAQIDLETTQQNKLNSIRKEIAAEALSATKAAQDAAIKANEEELALFIAQQGFRKKSADEELEIAKTVRDAKIANLDEAFEYGKMSQVEYETALIETKNEYLKKELDLVVENAQKETDAVINEIERRQTNFEEYTQEKLEFEKQAILDREEAFANEAKIRLENGVINEQKYQEEIAKIKEDSRLAEQDAVLAWEEADKERRLIDLENQAILDEEAFLNEFDLRASRLDEMRAMELANAEKTGADKALILKKYAIAEQAIELEKEQAKRDIAAGTFGEIASLLGEHTAASKAAAVAEALINTYSGVTQVWRAPSILPEPFATAAKVVSTGTVLASGFAAISNIKNTEVTKAEKGALFEIGGKRHSQGGTRFRGEDGTEFEAEQGELIGVLNRNASAAFMRYNNSFLPDGSGMSRNNYLASGGIVSRQVTSSGGSESSTVVVPDTIDYDKLAAKIAQANASLPAPWIAVTDINTGQANYAKVKDGAIV